MADPSKRGDNPHPDNPKNAKPAPPEAKKPEPPPDELLTESTIDLGMPGPGPGGEPVDLSGVSVIEWADLVEEPASKPKVDSPSDSDILSHAEEKKPDAPAAPRAQPTALKPPGAEEEAAVADRDSGSGIEFAVPAGSSAIDVGEEAVIVEEPPVVAADSAVEVGKDAVIIEEAAPAVPASGSGIDLGADVVVVEDASPSKQPPSGSGIDLGAADLIEEVAAEAPASGSGIDLGAEHLILESDSGKPGSDSRRDLIAEAVESGVDLLPKEGERPAEVDATTVHEDPTSKVDLGSLEAVKADDAADVHLERYTELPEGTREPEPTEEEPALGAAARGKPAAKGAGESHFDVSALEEAAEEQAAAVAETAEGEAVVVDEDEPRADRPARKAPKPDEEEDEAGRPKREKPRGRATAWVGGGLAGLLVGAGACVALWAAGLVPGADSAGKVNTTPTNGTRTGGPALVTFAAKAEHVKNGDLEKAAQAGIETIDESKPEELAARAEYRWLAYLKDQAAKDAQPPFTGDADPVKNALADLNKVADKDAKALLLRAQIHELTGKPDLAKKDLEAGADRYKNDAALKEQFETALLALQLRTTKAGAWAPGPPNRLRAAALLALMAGLQAPPTGGPKAGGPKKPDAKGGGKAPDTKAGGPKTPDAKAAPDEAGFRFWQAVKLARERKYADAIKALDEARARHAKRRFVNLRKQQNPLSDPTEEIFLRCCDELKAAWELEGKLRNPDYLAAEEKDRWPVVDALVKKSADNARSEQLKELSAKLAKDKAFATPKDLIAAVEAERKASADKMATLEKNVDARKKEVAALEGKLKDATALTLATQDKLKVAEKHEAELKAASTEANAALKEVAAAVGVKLTDAKADQARLVTAVKDADRLAKMKDPKGEIGKLERDLAADRAKLKERWEPDEMLPVWLAVLREQRDRKDLAERATRDAERVLAAPSATPVQKARAEVIRGLALRNEEKFDEARPKLEKARGVLADAKGPWVVAADAALREVADPAAFYADRAEALQNKGRAADALTTANEGLKVAKDKRGRLLALRALLTLEQARAKGAVTAADLAGARKDAAAAADEGVAEGHFALGRIAEELGQWRAAADAYRAALKASPASSRYRVALARVLLRAGDRAPAPRGDAETGRAPRRATPKVRLGLRAADVVAMLLAVTLQPADVADDVTPAQKEAEKLADEVLADPKAPFDALAQALAVKGLYTQALRTYADGLRKQGLLAPVHANALLDLIARHPMLRRPESRNVPDPLIAEKHYSAGLNFYTARRYADAEKELLAAIENDNGDARYYYFLGLARLAQGKRDAAEDFDAGARLEREGRPDRAAVSTALERVQGAARRRLNAVRERPAREKDK
jgi:hypothetical protein